MSDITNGGVAKINCKFRESGVVEVTLPIVGAKITKYQRFGKPKSVDLTFGYYDGERWFTKGSEHGKNASSNVIITGFNGGSDINLAHCLYQGWGGLPSGSYDHLAWNSLFNMYSADGILSVEFDTPVVHQGKVTGIVVGSNGLPISDTKNMMVEKTESVQIDWAKTLEPITDPSSANYLDPTVYRVMAYDGAVNPTVWSVMDDSKKDQTNKSPLTATDIAGDIERAYFGSAGDNPTSYLTAKRISGAYQVESGKADIIHNNANTTEAVKDGDNCYYVKFHPYITLYLIRWDSISWNADNELAVGDEKDGITDENIDDAENKDKTTNASSNTTSYTIGGTSGIHRTPVHYNDYKTAAEITYLSTADYNSFVSAGSGIISDSIVHASDKTLYIESVELDMAGSSMTVVQLEEFDSTLKLTAGERIYGYILNDSLSVQPVFAGWVTSISRRLGDSGQEIVYKCRDWKFYFNQLYTPMLYQNKASLKTIVNDLLIKAGITNFENNLPNITVTVEYQAQSIMDVLDWACTLSGDYWFWIDVNGKLHIDKINGTTHSFAIPTKGDSVGDNKVLRFDSLSDLSNSRSKIVVSGGSGSKIYEKSVSHSRSYQHTYYDNIQQAIDVGAKGVVRVYPHDYYYIIRKKNVKFYSQMITEGRNAWVDNYIALPYPLYATKPYEWVSEGSVSIQNDTIRGDSVVYARIEHYMVKMYFAEKRLDEDLSVSVDTGNPGGVYLYKNSSFRYVVGLHSIIDDTPLMQSIAGNLANYFRPVYGGTLELAGLRTELHLGEKISLTNTSLPAIESTDLKIFRINFNLVNQITTVELSDRMNIAGTAVDPEVIRNNVDYYRKELADNNNYIIRNHLQY